MRRLAAISAIALFLAVPLWAQHGGGHAGGGHGGGFGGGHAGFSGGRSGGLSGAHVSGGHASGGVRSGPIASRGFTRAPAYSQRSFSRDPFLNRSFRGNRFRDRDRFRTHGFRNNCYGYPCRDYGYPWGYGYYDPLLWDWWDSGSTYDQDDPSQDVAAAAEMNRENLEEQRMLRQEEADGDRDLYARSVPAPRATVEAEGAPVQPDTVLVFRDQHKQDVRNYAIVGQTLWNFSPQRTEKIPLSELDLPATAKANDDRGLTFRVPANGEAQ